MNKKPGYSFRKVEIVQDIAQFAPLLNLADTTCVIGCYSCGTQVRFPLRNYYLFPIDMVENFREWGIVKNTYLGEDEHLYCGYCLLEALKKAREIGEEEAKRISRENDIAYTIKVFQGMMAMFQEYKDEFLQNEDAQKVKYWAVSGLLVDMGIVLMSMQKLPIRIGLDNELFTECLEERGI